MNSRNPQDIGAGFGTNTNRISSRPSGTNSPLGGRQITIWGLLDAFRRRWLPALGLAIPAALLTAALIWELVPAKYESSALIKIHQYEQVLHKATNERTSELNTFRNSQINYIKSRPVLTSALRFDGVVETQLLSDVQHPLEWLAEELEVEEDLSPEFIRIGLSGEHPEDLALVVDAVKDAYMDEVVFNERKERIERLKQLKESFQKYDQDVKANQERIAKLAENLGTGDSKVAVGYQELIQQQIRELQTDLREINSQIRAEETTRQFLKDRGLSDSQLNQSLPGVGFGTSTRPSGPATAVDPRNNLQQQLLAIRRQIRQFESQIRNPDHPDLLALKEQESQLSAMLTGSTGNSEGTPGLAMSNYEWLQTQKKKLETEIREQTEELKNMGSRVAELERERADIAYLVKTRDNLLDEIQKREIELNAPQRVNVIQHANVPEVRNVKAKIQLSLLATMAVFGSIVAGFTLFEWFSHRVGGTSDLTSEIGLRVIGSIPSPDKGGLFGLGVFAGKVDFDEWNRAVIESMDVVRTYLMRHIDPSRSASILITSASANEGKTTVSCQLAASLARTGKKAVIVDCDFRRPSAHQIVKASETPGIAEFLRGEVELKDICQQTDSPGLTFVAAGKIDQATLQKLSFDGGRSIIAALKERFDFVIIDTSPLLFVAEPSMLAQNADMVLLSTRKDFSRVPYVIQTRDSLRSLQVPVVGSVMVGSDSDFQRQTYGYRQEVQKSAQLIHS